MKRIAAIFSVSTILLISCRGEPVPRDYQNNPPGRTNPADSPAEAPAQNPSEILPEPSSGAEGTSAPYKPVEPPRTTPQDPPPPNDSSKPSSTSSSPPPGSLDS